MTDTAPAITDEMLELLREGAKTAYGRCCLSLTEQKKHAAAIEDLFRLRLAFAENNGIRSPIITDEGRAAIGAPTQSEMQRRELAAVVAGHRNFTPSERREAALKFSGRKHERVALMFVVHNEADNWMQVSVDGRPDKAPPIYIKSKFGMPEMVVTARVGRFIVAHVVGRVVMERGFRQRNAPLLSKDIEWSDDDKRDWRSLRLEMLKLRHTLEQQQRRERGHRPEPTRYRFGESA